MASIPTSGPEAWSRDAFQTSCGVVAFDTEEPRTLKGDLDAIGRHLGELFELAAKTHEHERRYQETREPIAHDEAVALAKRIKDLPAPIDGRKDFIASLASRCLTLQEGQAAGEVFRVSVCWELGEAAREVLAVVADAEAALKAAGMDATSARGYRVQFEVPPERDEAAAWWRTVILAVPAELQFSRSPFGVLSAHWLHRQCEAVARERARRDFPPESPARRMYNGGDFSIPILDVPVAPIRPGPAVSVVPAPDEGTIRKYIKRAKSCPDHWDALKKAAEVLRRSGQPLGEALSDWLLNEFDRRRPKGSKAAKAPANALRNHAIIAAVQALGRCGRPAMTHDCEPGSACDVVAEV